MNNKLKITKKKRYEFYTFHRKKVKQKKIGICSILGPEPGPGSGSVIPRADPLSRKRKRIRIRLKMKRIRNTSCIYYLIINIMPGLGRDRVDPDRRQGQREVQREGQAGSSSDSQVPTQKKEKISKTISFSSTS